MRRGFSMSNQVHCRRPVRNLTLTGCFAAVLGGLILFLCLVCVSVTVTLNFRPLYYLDMKLLHISDISGYSNDVIRKNFDALIRYNNIWHTGILNFPDFPMSESGRIHFEEVKKVFSVFRNWDWKENTVHAGRKSSSANRAELFSHSGLVRVAPCSNKPVPPE